MKSILKHLAIAAISIAAHEAGHAISLIAADVDIEVVQIGIGPVIHSIDSDPPINFSPLPIFGYVQIPADGPGSLKEQPFTIAIIAMLAGIGVNACLGFIFILFYRRKNTFGKKMTSYLPRFTKGNIFLESIAFSIIVMTTTIPLVIYYVVKGKMKELAKEPKNETEVKERADDTNFFFTSAILNFGLVNLNILPMHPFDGGKVILKCAYELGIEPSVYNTASTIIGVTILGSLVVTECYLLYLKKMNSK